MTEPHQHTRTNEQPHSLEFSSPIVRGGQRQDIPYHDRAQAAYNSPSERRIRYAIAATVTLLSLAALALLWYMIARSTRGI